MNLPVIGGSLRDTWGVSGGMAELEPTMDLQGRVALVTGSTAGLGLEIARGLGLAGARVALNYRNDEARARVALERYLETGAEGALIRADVTDESAIEALIDSVTDRLGPIDILVVNATPSQPQRALEDYEWGDVQAMLDAFVKSPFLLSQRVVGHMKERGWGRIIHIGSEVLDEGAPNFSAYVAAKGAQNGLSRSLAKELAPWNITVNMVSPGWIPVERHAEVSAADKESYLASIPMGRWGTPTDIASAVTFLASEHARFVTGANLHVNGGRSVQ